LGSPNLTTGARLTGLPASLTYSTTSPVTVPAYYVVKDGDTWATIAGIVYGDANAGDQLRQTLNNPLLTKGSHLTGLPASLTYGVVTTAITVPPYYLVKAGDTWTSIATALYGTASVAAQLQAALSNPSLIEGGHLVGLPGALTYATSSIITVP